METRYLANVRPKSNKELRDHLPGRLLGRDEDAKLILTDALAQIIQSNCRTDLKIAIAQSFRDACLRTSDDQAAADLGRLITGLETQGGSIDSSLFIRALRDDKALVTQTLATIEAIHGQFRPFWSAFIPHIFFGSLVPVILFVPLALASIDNVSGAIVGLVFSLPIILYLTYAIRTTRYEFKNGVLMVHKGGLARNLEMHELYRLHAVKVRRGVFNRVSGDCRIRLTFDQDEKAVLRGLCKRNEADKLALALREISRAIRANPNIKGILT